MIAMRAEHEQPEHQRPGSHGGLSLADCGTGGV